MGIKVNLKKVRMIWPKLFEKDQPKKADQKAAYRCELVLPEDHPQYDELYDAALEVMTEKLGSAKQAEKWMERNFGIGNHSKDCAVKDGNERDDVSEAYEDMIYIRTKSFKQPRIQTSDGEDQNEDGLTIEGDPIEGEQIYGGCYVNASVELWGWNRTDGKGLGVGILGVRFREDGEAFGGGSSETASDDDLDDDEGSSRKRGKAKPSSRRDREDDEKPKGRAKPSSRRSREDDDDGDEKPRRSRRDRDEEDEKPKPRARPSARRSRDEDAE